MVRKPPRNSIFSWQAMEHEFLQQFYNTQKRVGIPKMIKTKQREIESITNFAARWRRLTFVSSQKFTQHELVCMCLKSFMDDLSTTLIP